jgi:preprotein translocase subunit SecE
MPAKEINDPKIPEKKNFLESVKEWPVITRDYINELNLEMKRVTWPNRKQVESTTAVVIFTVFGFAAFFWIVDTVLVRLVAGVQHAFTR